MKIPEPENGGGGGAYSDRVSALLAFCQGDGTTIDLSADRYATTKRSRLGLIRDSFASHLFSRSDDDLNKVITSLDLR